MTDGRASLPDALLDRTVIASYTNLGFALRSPRWDESDLAAMDGKVVLVTGATSGLGEAAASGFARLGASVWLVARSRERGEDARTRIAEQTGSDDVHVGICDLSDLRSVRRFAEQCEAGPGRLDVLVNNAGVLTEERSLSRDGIELTLATNVVGPFLLTKLLMPLLLRSAPARVINVSSGGMYTQGLHVEDLQSARGRFRGTAAYARSQAHAGGAERAVGARGSRARGWWSTRCTRVGSTRPGCAIRCPAFTESCDGCCAHPQQGADTIVWLGSAPQAAQISGSFWFDRARRPTHLLPWGAESEQDRRRLWTEIERLSG